MRGESSRRRAGRSDALLAAPAERRQLYCEKKRGSSTIRICRECSNKASREWKRKHDGQGAPMMLHRKARTPSPEASRVDGPSKLVLIMLAKRPRPRRSRRCGVVFICHAGRRVGVGINAITRTMDRLTKAGIIRIVSKAAQGRSARKAIDWAALAAAERDSGPVQNFENHRSGEPRITTAVNQNHRERGNCSSPRRGFQNHHGADGSYH